MKSFKTLGLNTQTSGFLFAEKKLVTHILKNSGIHTQNHGRTDGRNATAAAILRHSVAAAVPRPP